MTCLVLWLGDPSYLAVTLFALSLCGHVAGAVTLYRCRKESRENHAKLEERLAKLEGGTTHQQMQKFVRHAVEIVIEERERAARTLDAGMPEE